MLGNVERVTSILRVTAETKRLNPALAKSSRRPHPGPETWLGLNHDFVLDLFNHPAHQAST